MSKPVQQIALEKAHEFYEQDSQLGQQQRSNLVGCFRNQMIAYPLVTVPMVIGLIRAPRYFFKGKKQVRLYQIFCGLGGVFIGQELSTVLANSWNSSVLASDPPAAKCYEMLSRFPSQFGYKYYQNTSHHPELAMKDPSTIDWTKEMSFPMNLIFTKRPQTAPEQKHLYQRPERKAEEWRQGFEKNAKDLQSFDFKETAQTPQAPTQAHAPSSPPAPSQAPSQTESAWDRIRRQNGTASSNPVTSIDSHYSEAKQQEFDNMIDRAKGGSYNSSLSEEQRRFDEMLERERSGASDDKW